MKNKTNPWPWLIAAAGAAVLAYIGYRLFKKHAATPSTDLPPVIDITPNH